MKTIWLSMAVLLWATSSQAGWPSLPSPPDSRVESVGDQVRLNGIPMRMQRVLSTRKPVDIIAFYRQVLGARHAEEKLPDGLLLAQGQGDYFVTVRIKRVALSLTETLVSISDARAAQHASERPLGLQLPARSQIVSDMESIDDGQFSRQLVFLNRHSIDTNIDFISTSLRAQGYRAQPEGIRTQTSERVLMFGGDKREARLVAIQKKGISNLVLTRVRMP